MTRVAFMTFSGASDKGDADAARPRLYAQGPPEYGRSCDYSEQVTMIAYYSL